MSTTRLEGRVFKVGLLLVLLLFLMPVASAYAGEDLYDLLSDVPRGKGDLALFAELNNAGRGVEWDNTRQLEFEGNLRCLTLCDDTGEPEETVLYLIRHLNGDLYILSIPEPIEIEQSGVVGFYENLDALLGDKLTFKIEVVEGVVVAGESYSFARLLERPQQVPLDQIFKVCITLMLFFIMVGMGLTLTPKDFQLVFKKPKAMLIGATIQWAIMPLVAVGLGHLLGYNQSYPFLFLGLLLVCVSPGGVSSNLMTYYAKGDLALSVSLTSFSTVLSLFFTPALLIFYAANVTEVALPVMLIIQTISVLVIVPLALGMLVRGKWADFARKATPIFSTLGIIALFFIVTSGVLTNLDKFADTERYGLVSYLAVVGLSFAGIIIGAFIPKLLKVNHYQARAISLESGLRNSILAMTIALLLQDIMGDFYSSMFAASAIFGIVMYLTGFAAIGLFKWILPLDEPVSPSPSVGE